MPLTNPAVTAVGASNGTYTSGRVEIAAGANITVGTDAGQKITIAAAAPGAGGGVAIAASNTTYTASTVSFTGVGGGVTVSSNTGQRVDISVAAPVAQTVQTQNMVVIQNSQTTYTSGTVNLVDLANITIRSTTGNKYEFSVAAPGGGAARSYWGALDGDVWTGTATQTLGNSTSYIQPACLPYDVSASYFRFPVSMGTSGMATIATSNTTFTASLVSTVRVDIYSRDVGASSLSLTRYGSASAGVTEQWSVSFSGGASGSQYTISWRGSYPQTGGTTLFSTFLATSLTNFNMSGSSSRWWTQMTGSRFIDIPFASSLAAGDYWLMWGVSSTVGTQHTNVITQNRLSFSRYMQTQMNSNWGHLGVATNASIQLQPGVGSFTTVGGATTGALGFSNISSSASHPFLLYALHNSSGI